MEVAYYLRIVRKWLWLILVAAILGVGLSFILTTGQVSLYSAQVTISVGEYIQDPNPTTAQIYVGQNLVPTYQQLVETENVLQGVIDDLKLSMGIGTLRAIISTDTIPNTSLLTIRVTYVDPILVADIANEVADQLIANSPTKPTADQQAQIDLANTQIQALTTQVTQQRAQKDQLDQEIASSLDTTQIQQWKQQEIDLVTQINQAASTIAQFQTTLGGLQSRLNVLTVVDRAVVPTGPSNSGRSSSSAVVGGLGGAILAFGLALLIEYLDDKIRTTEAAVKQLSLPVLGAIPHFGKKRADNSERLVVNFPSMSEITESYRRLRTNLVYMMGNGQEKLFVVTSPGPGEGKSVTSANLAVTFASAGIRVLLIDADLRRPVAHEFFGLKNDIGLTTLLLADPSNVSGSGFDQGASELTPNLDKCIQPTQIPNLKVITSGPVPANPAELLSSTLMKRWIEAFRMSSNIDIVIFDTPPIVMFSDSTVIASHVSMKVLLVIDSRKTRRSAALKAREQLQQIGADAISVVLNQVNPRDDPSYYGEQYYKSYYPNGDKATSSGFLRWIRR